MTCVFALIRRLLIEYFVRVEFLIKLTWSWGDLNFFVTTQLAPEKGQLGVEK